MNISRNFGRIFVLATVLLSFSGLRSADAESPDLSKLNQRIIQLEQDRRELIHHMKFHGSSMPTLNMEKHAIEKELITLRGKVVRLYAQKK